MSESVKILVVGTGAIGGYYGGRLSQTEAEVSVLARSDFEVVRNKGIEIQCQDGDFHFQPVEVVREASELSFEPDYVLVCLKVLPEIDVAQIIRPVVGKHTTIALLQNGAEIEPPICEAFPENEVISGLAFICSRRNAPGKIQHLDYGRLNLGLYPEGTSAKTEQLVELFCRAGVDCQLSTQVKKARWVKLAWNAPFNPISVLGGQVNTHEMLQNPNTRQLIYAVMKEVQAVATAADAGFGDEIIERLLTDTENMTPYDPSMLLDYRNRRAMEVEAILGNALRAAQRLKIDVPHLTSLYGLLDLIDRKNRGLTSPKKGS